MEETLTYWQHFQIFHASIRGISWPILLNVTIGLFFFSILRSVFFYATARKFEGWENSSLLLWSLEKLFNKFLATEDERQNSEPDITLRGGHILGGWLDIAAWIILGAIFIWLWPIIFVVTILFGPIQISRNHFMKKKLFMAKLKGEKLDI